MGRKRNQPDVPFAIRWTQAVLLSEVTIAGRRVAQVLLAHADADGRCYPSVARVAWFVRGTRRTVFRGLESLEQHNLIRRDQGYSGKANRYTLTIPTRCSDDTTQVLSWHSPVTPEHPEVLQKVLQEVPNDDFGGF